MSIKYKFQMYKHLQANTANIYAEAKKAAEEIGLTSDLKGQVGLTGAISGCPAPMRKSIIAAGEAGAGKVIPLATLVEQIRELVKDVYGDDWDVCPVNTCEAGLWVSFDALCTPPNLGRGDNYRARYIAPYEKHMHHQASYGRPFPPRYKDLLADRGSTAGEMGFYGKRQNNLDTVIVPLVGAKYPNHGIKYWPVPFLSEVDPDESIDRIDEAAAINAETLTGVTSLGYDTPGYGYGVKSEDGAPLLQKYIGEMAKSYNIPYIVDNAWGLPFVGTDPRKINADVIIYSMDKATGSATSGLIIGKEDVMVNIRRALGMHGDRWGTLASYGKAAYVTQDPGKEALLTQVAVLKDLIENPGIYTKPVDQLYDMVIDECKELHPKIRAGLSFAKSYNSTTVEINYESTWKDEGLGFPVFSIEDMYAGSHLIQTGCSQMGIIPTISYDANLFLSPGQGTADEDGNIIEDKMRLVIKGLFRLMNIIGKYSGYTA